MGKFDAFWKAMAELKEQANRNHLDDVFCETLIELCDDPVCVGNDITASALFDFLLELTKRPKFQAIAVNLLRRPFGLLPEEPNVGLVKCSMVFANALPYEHHQNVFEAWRSRFEKELSFLLVSEDWDVIREGLTMLSEADIMMPSAAHNELAQAVEESNMCDFIPETYMRVIFEKELWEDPLLQSLSKKNDKLADCLVLKALIQFRNGHLNSNLLRLVQNIKTTMTDELKDSKGAFIVEQFQKLRSGSASTDL